jgi:hypothetical protein
MTKQYEAALWFALAVCLPLNAQSPMPTAPASDTASTSTHEVLPEAPAPVAKQRVEDWKYSAITGALFAASVSDAETLVRCDNCTFIPASMHRRGVTIGIGLPVDVAVSYFGYRLKKHGRRWWYVPAVALTAANAYLSYHWAASTD